MTNIIRNLKELELVLNFHLQRKIPTNHMSLIGRGDPLQLYRKYFHGAFFLPALHLY